MAHPLFALARRLEQRNRRKQRRLAADFALDDPHIAQDLGLPYRPKPKPPRVDQW